MIRNIQLVVLFIFLGIGVMADPPDPNGSGSGSGGPLPGGGAPISGGYLIFVAMAAAYGTKKVYQLKFKKPNYKVIG